MKIENKETDVQVGAYKRILRPIKDANDVGIIINSKSRIVPTKEFGLGNFLPTDISESEPDENIAKQQNSRITDVFHSEECSSKLNQDPDNTKMSSNQNKGNSIRRSSRNL